MKLSNWQKRVGDAWLPYDGHNLVGASDVRVTVTGDGSGAEVVRLSIGGIVGEGVTVKPGQSVNAHLGEGFLPPFGAVRVNAEHGAAVTTRTTEYITIGMSEYYDTLQGRWINTGCVAGSGARGVAVSASDIRAYVTNKTSGFRGIRLRLVGQFGEINSITSLGLQPYASGTIAMGASQALRNFLAINPIVTLRTDHTQYVNENMCSIVTTASLVPPGVPSPLGGIPIPIPQILDIINNPPPLGIPPLGIPDIPPAIPSPVPQAIPRPQPGQPYRGAVVFLSKPWNQLPLLATQIQAGIVNGAGLLVASLPDSLKPYSCFIVYGLPLSNVDYNTAFNAWSTSFLQLVAPYGIRVDVMKTDQGGFIPATCYNSAAGYTNDMYSATAVYWDKYCFRDMWDAIGGKNVPINFAQACTLDGAGYYTSSEDAFPDASHNEAALFDPDRVKHQSWMHYCVFSKADNGQYIAAPFGFPSVAGKYYHRNTYNTTWGPDDIINAYLEFLEPSHIGQVHFEVSIANSAVTKYDPRLWVGLHDKIASNLRNGPVRFAVIPSGNSVDVPDDYSADWGGNYFTKVAWDFPDLRRQMLIVQGSNGYDANIPTSESMNVKSEANIPPLIVSGIGVNVPTLYVDAQGTTTIQTVDGSSPASMTISALCSVMRGLGARYDEVGPILAATCEYARNNGWQMYPTNDASVPHTISQFRTRTGLGIPNAGMCAREAKKQLLYHSGALTALGLTGGACLGLSGTIQSRISGNSIGGNGTAPNSLDNIFAQIWKTSGGSAPFVVAYQRLLSGGVLGPPMWISDTESGPLSSFTPFGSDVTIVDSITYQVAYGPQYGNPVASTRGDYAGSTRLWISNELFQWDPSTRLFGSHPSVTYTPYYGNRFPTGDVADNSNFPFASYGYYVASIK